MQEENVIRDPQERDQSLALPAPGGRDSPQTPPNSPHLAPPMLGSWTDRLAQVRLWAEGDRAWLQE